MEFEDHWRTEFPRELVHFFEGFSVHLEAIQGLDENSSDSVRNGPWKHGFHAHQHPTDRLNIVEPDRTNTLKLEVVAGMAEEF